VILTIKFLTKTGWIYMIQYNPYPLRNFLKTLKFFLLQGNHYICQQARLTSEVFFAQKQLDFDKFMQYLVLREEKTK
jgi:hypothetical protein